MEHKIIAIVGMCGAGKSVGCKILEDKGFKVVYFGKVTMDILKDKNMEITPENEKLIREDLRNKYGMSAFATILKPKIKELLKDNNVVLDGLYSWDELVLLKEEFKDNLIVIAIVADKNIRYERLSKRDIRSLNNLQAKDRDIAEIENLAKGGPISYADFYILNNGSLSDYEDRMLSILKEIW